MAIECTSVPPAVTPITHDEREFHVAMGERIAQLRKARSLTQTQLADALGVKQQTVQGYESGSRRIPISALPLLAKTLQVSLEVLFGEEVKSAARRRGPVPQWHEQMEAIAKLPRAAALRDGPARRCACAAGAVSRRPPPASAARTSPAVSAAGWGGAWLFVVSCGAAGQRSLRLKHLKYAA